MVLKFCDGYYLEGQDYWRLAGIFDDVTIYATPKVRIYDWYVTTDFGPDFVDSDLKLAMDVRSYGLEGSGYKVKATVSKDGREVAGMENGPFDIKDGTSTINLSAKVKAPKKWTAETPELYDLTMDLIGPDGEAVDHIVKRIGFKKLPERPAAQGKRPELTHAAPVAGSRNGRGHHTPRHGDIKAVQLQRCAHITLSSCKRVS